MHPLPLAVELRPAPDVESALLRLASRPHCLLLDSALRDPRLGRYSFLMADPFEYFTIPADGTDGLSFLEAQLRLWPALTRPELPPFQGGAGRPAVVRSGPQPGARAASRVRRVLHSRDGGWALRHGPRLRPRGASSVVDLARLPRDRAVAA